MVNLFVTKNSPCDCIQLITEHINTSIPMKHPCTVPHNKEMNNKWMFPAYRQAGMRMHDIVLKRLTLLYSNEKTYSG